ncbi:hypothetical protein [Nocardioides pantholopis]|uniref:hypothetical protein n=1 Tax=Nocardioides pantholopis TaxID=2483798 RepID=UPI0019CFF4D3|nr:hypothetical protein [Nocardioides pantholopis]
MSVPSSKILALLAVLVSALLLVPLGLLVLGPPGAAGSLRAPAGDTIVDVTGDAENGFEIHRYDGSALFPPTRSEAVAECGEYDARVARVRCRTEVRIWYRDLADLRQALEWSHAD